MKMCICWCLSII